MAQYLSEDLRVRVIRAIEGDVAPDHRTSALFLYAA